MRNAGLHFVCRDQRLRVESDRHARGPAGSRPAHEIVVPLKSGEGRYVADAATLAAAGGRGPRRVPLRRRQPQRLGRDIAGISSADGRVVGLMPHPEHAIDALTGPSDDGLGLFTSVLGAAVGS